MRVIQSRFTKLLFFFFSFRLLFWKHTTDYFFSALHFFQHFESNKSHSPHSQGNSLLRTLMYSGKGPS